MAKERLSASVDIELIEQARAAVAAGRADNVSAWVNEALRLYADEDRGLAAFDKYMTEYEAEFGEITPEEIKAVEREMKEKAVTTGGGGATKRRGAA
jgi:Arc/MetJ-type ribon-helix-helix transcriptional regulator